MWYNIGAQTVVQLCFTGGLLMQHFQKQQFGTRLLALGLSAGLIMGSLTGCGNQGQDTGSSDTLAASTMISIGAWTLPRYLLWRTAA